MTTMALNEMDSESMRRSRDDGLEECNLPDCKLEKQNYEYMRSAARRYLRISRIAYGALAGFLLVGIVILFFIFKNNLNAKPLDGVGINRVRRFRTAVNNLLGEEVFYHETHKTVYMAFKKKVKKEDASELCSASIGGKVVSVKFNDSKLNGLFNRTARDFLPYRTFWSSGVISSENPGLIQWDNSSVTMIEQSRDVFRRVVDGRMNVDGKMLTITNYTNFCNESQALAEIKKLSLDATEPQTFDVIVDYRRRTASRTDPLGCWIILPEEDEHYLICQADMPLHDIYFPFDPQHVGKRYSRLSNMTYRLFESTHPLIDATRICEENNASLLSFDSQEDEQHFDNLVWNLRDRMFADLLNEKREIALFTSGMYWFNDANEDMITWGRGNRFAQSDVTYTNFCDGETDKAKYLFNKNTSKRHFIILKHYSERFLSLKAFEDDTSCWRLLAYTQAKIPTLEHHFACQSHEIGSFWRRIKLYFGWEDVDVHLG